MKAKNGQNELFFDRKSEALRFHVLMEMRHRSLDGAKPISWNANDRFLVHEGHEDGEFFAYRSAKFSGNQAEAFLHQRGYCNFLAAGIIDSARKLLRFEQPFDKEACARLLRRITVDDSRFIEYYGDFVVIAADGDSLGKMELHWLVSADRNSLAP